MGKRGWGWWAWHGYVVGFSVLIQRFVWTHGLASEFLALGQPRHDGAAVG